jgi:hypothetical protein
VLDVDSEDLLQVPATHDEQPVQALGPHRPDRARRRRWRWAPAPASAPPGRPLPGTRRRRCGRTSRHDREQECASGRVGCVKSDVASELPVRSTMAR